MRFSQHQEEEKLLAPRVPWRHSALRHSFCSYRLADVKSAAQVALEADLTAPLAWGILLEHLTGKAEIEPRMDANRRE